MNKVLIIERSDEIRPIIERRFGANVNILTAPTVKAARENLKQDGFDAIVWDTAPDHSQWARLVHVLHKLSKYSRDAKIIITSDAEEPAGINLENFSGEWIQRPFSEEELSTRFAAAIENRTFDKDVTVPTEFEGILTNSLIMRSIVQQIMEAAGEDIPVLVTGETGTGKDLVAAAIHKRSKRKDFPFLPVNMGAITAELIASELFGHEKGAYTGASEARAGFFEQALGGTIFLDEIATMDEKTQVSLLRVLETKTIRRVRGDRDIKVNVRVIAATNENIEEAVKVGRFREDLYYRLDVFRIHLPPLRERPGGVSLLTDHFVSRFDEQYKKDIRVVSPETYRLLRHYSWPGNVRELKNVIQRAVLLAKGAELTPELLPPRICQGNGSGSNEVKAQSPIQLGMSLAEVEKEFIKMTLASVSGNKMKAASALGISRRALYNKLKRFALL
jgi:DNA-binding NtrC family response regulator